MVFLVNRLSFEHPVKLTSELFGQVYQSFDDSLFQDFSDGFFKRSKAEVKTFVVGSDSRKAVQVEEDEEQLSEERGEADLGEDAVPLVDSFVEDSHNCQQIMRFLLVVVDTKYIFFYSLTHETSLSTKEYWSLSSTVVEE